MMISETMKIIAWLWFFIATPLLIVFLLILHLELDIEEKELKGNQNE